MDDQCIILSIKFAPVARSQRLLTKEFYMKNFLLLLVLSLVSSSLVAGETCSNGTCRQPLSKVVNVTEKIVTAPVRATRNFVAKSKIRSQCRRGYKCR